MTRNRVDLPDPERPSRPTISPSRKARFTPSSTRSWSPSGLRKAWLTLCTSRRGEVFTFYLPEYSVQPELAFGAVIQRPPEKAIYHHDEQTHHHRAERHPPIIGGGGRGCDIGTEARR